MPFRPERIPAAIRLPKAPEIMLAEKNKLIRKFSSDFVYHLLR